MPEAKQHADIYYIFNFFVISLGAKIFHYVLKIM
jgi:hypothetical protein